MKIAHKLNTVAKLSEDFRIIIINCLRTTRDIFTGKVGSFFKNEDICVVLQRVCEGSALVFRSSLEVG